MTPDEARTQLIERTARRLDNNYPYSDSESQGAVEQAICTRDIATDVVNTILSARGPCPTCDGTSPKVRNLVQYGGDHFGEDYPDDCDGLGPLLVLTALGGEYIHVDGEADYWRFPVVSTSEKTQ